MRPPYGDYAVKGSDSEGRALELYLTRRSAAERHRKVASEQAGREDLTLSLACTHGTLPI